MTTAALSPARKTTAYRQRMRESGFRQITAWVLDTRNEQVKKALERECQAIAQCPDNQEWLDFAEQNFNEFADDWKYD